jgi:sodium pump decarboxylase gamma subunit
MTRNFIGTFTAGVGSEGVQVLVLGLAIVFVVLAILIILLKLMAKFMTKKNLTVDDTRLSAEEVIEYADEDTVTVAVITAAIYSILSSTDEKRSNIGFRVRSIKRI